MTMYEFNCSELGVEIRLLVKVEELTMVIWYKIPLWPKKALSCSVRMDPLLAISNWELLRGDRAGFLFRAINRKANH